MRVTSDGTMRSSTEPVQTAALAPGNWTSTASSPSCKRTPPCVRTNPTKPRKCRAVPWTWAAAESAVPAPELR